MNNDTSKDTQEQGRKTEPRVRDVQIDAATAAKFEDWQRRMAELGEELKQYGALDITVKESDALNARLSTMGRELHDIFRSLFSEEVTKLIDEAEAKGTEEWGINGIKIHIKQNTDKKSPDRKKRPYRTARRAADAAFDELFDPSEIKTLVLPTEKGIKNALTSRNDGISPYMIKAEEDLQSIAALIEEKGRFYIAGANKGTGKRAAREVDIQELINSKGVTARETLFMLSLYTLCWNVQKARENNVKAGIAPPDVRQNGEIKLFMPDLLKFINAEPRDKSETGKRGGQIKTRGIKQERIEKRVREISNLNRLMGVIPGDNGGLYAVVFMKEFDRRTNTMTLEMPYLNRLYEYANADQTRREREAIDKAKKTLKALPKGKRWKALREVKVPPEYSHLVKSSIHSARNKVAALNAVNIVRLIETAGPESEPSIKWRTLINQNPELAEALKGDLRPNQLLKRVFAETTWKYIDKHTELKQKYPGLRWEFSDGKSYPTLKTLDEVVRFHHECKHLKNM